MSELELLCSVGGVLFRSYETDIFMRGTLE